MIKGIWVKGNENILDALEIRKKVFIEEQGVDKNIELDNKDSSCYHLIVYDKDIPVGTCRLSIYDNNYLIGRVAVIKEYRGQAFGDFIMKMAIRKSFDMGAKEVIVHAQLRVKEFYEKLGFSEFGKTYKEADILHINMKRTQDVGGCCNCPAPS